jgi:hypothetical protein
MIANHATLAVRSAAFRFWYAYFTVREHRETAGN